MCHEKTPHYTTSTSLNRWDKAGWSMLSCSSRHILTLHLNVAEIKTHQIRQRFSNLLLSSFGESVWIVSSVCCSYLTGAAPVWSSAAGAHLLQGSTCCVFRDIAWFDIQVIWVTVVFLSSLTSLSILLWPLTSTRHFHPHNCRSLDIFSFSGPFSVNPRDGCVWKSQ